MKLTSHPILPFREATVNISLGEGKVVGFPGSDTDPKEQYHKGFSGV